MRRNPPPPPVQPRPPPLPPGALGDDGCPGCRWVTPAAWCPHGVCTGSSLYSDPSPTPQHTHLALWPQNHPPNPSGSISPGWKTTGFGFNPLPPWLGLQESYSPAGIWDLILLEAGGPVHGEAVRAPGRGSDAPPPSPSWQPHSPPAISNLGRHSQLLALPLLPQHAWPGQDKGPRRSCHGWPPGSWVQPWGGAQRVPATG